MKSKTRVVGGEFRNLFRSVSECAPDVAYLRARKCVGLALGAWLGVIAAWTFLAVGIDWAFFALWYPSLALAFVVFFAAKRYGRRLAAERYGRGPARLAVCLTAPLAVIAAILAILAVILVIMRSTFRNG